MRFVEDGEDALEVGVEFKLGEVELEAEDEIGTREGPGVTLAVGVLTVAVEDTVGVAVAGLD